MENIKKIFKKINIDELLFDIILLVISNTIGFLLLNENLLNSDNYNDSYKVTALAGIFVFLLFINIGEIIGRYKKATKIKSIRFLFFLFIILSSFSIFIIAVDIIEEIDSSESDVLALIIVACIILGFVIGYFSKIKSFVKTIKITGIVTFVFLFIALTLFILYQIDRNHLRDVEVIFAGILLILGIVFLLILPKRTAIFITKKDTLKKTIITALIILSAVSFSLWDFVIHEKYIIKDHGSTFKKDDFFYLMYLPLIVYRFLLAAAPPKNKINTIIGIAVLLILILF